ncbi:MAG: M23 family metallopeptidase [Methylotenera sp.]|uniref:M23 family metallopeptidase n=1 Tax=Methylotenera sp. TaxID=2051956 RepID=UPI002486EDDC|nr:M23 family metallopeptidase [Methylotenera sp.]MDI1309772.1 M23 family metallopeptidase [Methylotenera sp.]
MNIIFVSNNMAKAKTLSTLHVGLLALLLISLPVLIMLFLIVPQEPATQQGDKSLIPSKLKLALGINNPQKHLDAYALQLGELQARIMRLDAQSERLAKMAGEKKPALEKIIPISHNLDTNSSNSNNSNSKNSKADPASRGGPLVLNAPITELDLQQKITETMAKIDFDTEYLSDIEAKLLQQGVLKDMLPNRSPVNAVFNSSSYGWRIDPFNGNKAFHEGLDFSAEVGTPIYAAAGGMVTTAERTSDYGNIVKVDHGSGLETRYAHASKLMVKVGSRVEKGQIVALVGSTGRSTGAHLHYEIRLNGNALDPRKYLKASN